MNQLENTTIPTVIFCGGKGSRLKEETEFKPKPMVAIGGQPILWHIMKTYSHYGHKSFVLCIGYKGDYIKQHFVNQKMLTNDFRVQNGIITEYHSDDNDLFDITFADTGQETPTGERLLRVEKYITENEFMVTYGDGVSNIDINALIAFHRAQKTIGTISGVHPTSKWGLVRVDAEKKVTAFEQKPVLHDFVNGGYMIFNRDFFRYLKKDQMIEDALIDLAHDGELSLYQHNGFWQAMDTYQDMESLNEQWNQNPQWKIWE